MNKQHKQITTYYKTVREQSKYLTFNLLKQEQKKLIFPTFIANECGLSGQMAIVAGALPSEYATTIQIPCDFTGSKGHLTL